MDRVPRDLRRHDRADGHSGRHDRRLTATLHLGGQDGSGLLSTLSGTLAFLAFLLAACQLLIHLYATSFVSAAAFDVARLASAEAPIEPQVARSHGLELLGGFAQRVSAFDVAIGEDDVTVRVQADSPALLPRAFGRIAGTASINRTVTLRREQPTCPGC